MSQPKQAIECTEVEVRVPWGHISGKWWGPQTNRPILALHGWQDNAGTFDTLIPLLPDYISILAIDFPGHGLSSRLPHGVLYHTIDYVYVIRMIMKEYRWNRVSIMAHSMGAIVAFWFASMFPNEIDILILLDTYRPFQFPVESDMQVLAKIMNATMLADERNCNDSEPPSYSYENCIDRVYHGTEHSIDKDKVSFLLTRNIRKSIKYPDQYYFTRDSRVKYMMQGIWPHDLYQELIVKLNKPFLFLKATKSQNNDTTTENYYANIALMKTNPSFEYHEVQGRHHVHLNQPEVVSGIISSFLTKHIPPRAKL